MEKDLVVIDVYFDYLLPSWDLLDFGSVSRIVFNVGTGTFLHKGILRESPSKLTISKLRAGENYRYCGSSVVYALEASATMKR